MQVNRTSRRVMRSNMRRADERAYYTTRGTDRRERLRSVVASPVIGADMKVSYRNEGKTTRTENLARRRSEEKSWVHATHSGEGIRASIAYGLWIGAAVVFAVFFLYGRINILGTDLQNRQMRATLASVQNECVGLEAEIRSKEDGIFVGYQAVDIGLVSDIGVEKQVLTAPASANLMLPGTY